MSLQLRSNKLLRLLFLATLGLLAAVSLFLCGFGTVWTAYDLKVLDIFYRKAVEHGRGSQPSPMIVIVAVTDRTYDYFGKNILDRKDLARVNEALYQLGAAAVAYDIIFARPGKPESDKVFAESITKLGCVYLPIGLAYADTASAFRWEDGPSYEMFRSRYLQKPIERGPASPYYGTRALMQNDRFSEAAFNAGHISAYSDQDGVYRHVIMLLRVGDNYFPTLSLAMFLDYVKVPFEKIVVEWGRRIVIPATPESFLEKDVIIPIDERGRAFIPHPQTWDRAFKKIEAHTLLKTMEDQDLRGNLNAFFEGRLVLIGDISVGTSDLGHTPLESDAPLILLHACMLNGMLTNTFYAQWPFWEAFGLIWILGLILGLSAAPRSSWFLYGTGIAVVAGILAFTWFQFTCFRLFPVATVGASVLSIFFGLVATLELVVGRERSFIKKAFSRYVPEKVVDNLLANPGILKLGGEKREMTVLFSDIEGFTSIAEKMPVEDLVHLLNKYLTAMTDIVLRHGGIIDKYEGDAIMAEFGAPLALPDHADCAVAVGLAMQRKLVEMRNVWASQSLPELSCRIGINTGTMVVGNMGSDQVFDYTVIGDTVNLASRLEGANKIYATGLLISEDTLAHLTPGRFRTRVLDVIKVQGKSRPVKVFEVYGEIFDLMEPADESYYRAYEEAFERYLSRDFHGARKKFQEALALRPSDPAASDILERLEGLDLNQLPADWDGSIALSSK